MTDLIYRGVAHTGIQSTEPRAGLALRYRGVAHDGLAAHTPISTKSAPMCYRGVRHGAEATGGHQTFLAGLLAA